MSSAAALERAGDVPARARRAERMMANCAMAQTATAAQKIELANW